MLTGEQDGSPKQVIDCATLPWPFGSNPWGNQLIVEMGRCTGVSYYL